MAVDTSALDGHLVLDMSAEMSLFAVNTKQSRETLTSLISVNL